MRVAVGSENPVKVAATEAAIGDLPGATVDAVTVDSGVAEQPTGLDETRMGARNRASRAYETGGYTLAVGIEGGVASLGTDDLYLVMWAAVTDGDVVELAAGPSVRLPDSVSTRIRSGEELGPVMDDEFDRDGVARDEGAIGIFTGGTVDREDALRSAVAGALGPFVTASYDD